MVWPKRTAWMASVGGVLAAGALLSVVFLVHPVQGQRAPSPGGATITPSRLGETTRDEASRQAGVLAVGTVCQHDPERGPEMVLIAGGEFQQGSPDSEDGRNTNESPQHSVTIQKPFAIGRCEITVGEFRQFVMAQDYQTDAEKGDGCFGWDPQEQKWAQASTRTWERPGFSQTDQRPVTCVSWNDAQAYIRWLNGWLDLEHEGAYRLPSESEWEFATRAGTRTPFFWGNQSQCQFANGLDQTAKQTGKFSDNLAYAECSDAFDYTAPVGSLLPNRWDLYDMSGNLWEWVKDCYVDSYEGAPVDGTARKAVEGESCEKRSLRGGGWNVFPQYLRSANRFGIHPDEAGLNAGFRLARTLAP